MTTAKRFKLFRKNPNYLINVYVCHSVSITSIKNKFNKKHNCFKIYNLTSMLFTRTFLICNLKWQITGYMTAK